MKKSDIIKLLRILLAVICVITIVVFLKVSSSSESMNRMNGVIVDMTNDSNLIVYTEDLNPGYEILSVHITENTKTGFRKAP